MSDRIQRRLDAFVSSRGGDRDACRAELRRVYLAYLTSRSANTPKPAGREEVERRTDGQTGPGMNQ